jgi:hypothetical protein
MTRLMLKALMLLPILLLGLTTSAAAAQESDTVPPDDGSTEQITCRQLPGGGLFFTCLLENNFRDLVCFVDLVAETAECRFVL